MKLDQEKVNMYLNKIHASSCPLCDNNNWTISDTVFQSIEFDYRGILINGASYPVVPLTCSACGNTYFINALVAGLIDPPQKESDDSAKNTNDNS